MSTTIPPAAEGEPKEVDKSSTTIPPAAEGEPKEVNKSSTMPPAEKCTPKEVEKYLYLIDRKLQKKVQSGEGQVWWQGHVNRIAKWYAHIPNDPKFDNAVQKNRLLTDLLKTMEHGGSTRVMRILGKGAALLDEYERIGRLAFEMEDESGEPSDEKQKGRDIVQAKVESPEPQLTEDLKESQRNDRRIVASAAEGVRTAVKPTAVDPMQVNSRVTADDIDMEDDTINVPRIPAAFKGKGKAVEEAPQQPPAVPVRPRPTPRQAKPKRKQRVVAPAKPSPMLLASPFAEGDKQIIEELAATLPPRSPTAASESSDDRPLTKSGAAARRNPRRASRPKKRNLVEKLPIKHDTDGESEVLPGSESEDDIKSLLRRERKHVVPRSNQQNDPPCRRCIDMSRQCWRAVKTPHGSCQPCRERKQKCIKVDRNVKKSSDLVNSEMEGIFDLEEILGRVGTADAKTTGISLLRQVVEEQQRINAQFDSMQRKMDDILRAVIKCQPLDITKSVKPDRASSCPPLSFRFPAAEGMGTNDAGEVIRSVIPSMSAYPSGSNSGNNSDVAGPSGARSLRERVILTSPSPPIVHTYPADSPNLAGPSRSNTGRSSAIPTSPSPAAEAVELVSPPIRTSLPGSPNVAGPSRLNNLPASALPTSPSSLPAEPEQPATPILSGTDVHQQGGTKEGDMEPIQPPHGSPPADMDIDDNDDMDLGTPTPSKAPILEVIGPTPLPSSPLSALPLSSPTPAMTLVPPPGPMTRSRSRSPSNAPEASKRKAAQDGRQGHTKRRK